MNLAVPRIARNVICLAAASLLAFTALAADVALTNAWMRPAPAGAESARAYVDIESAATLDLVGASTPVAKSVAIVHVARIGDPSTEAVVKSLPVRAGATTRLAFRGDHLRLVDVNRDLANGTPVPLTLVFKDASGKEVRATTDVVVRGLLLPQHMSPDARDAPRSAPATAPASPPAPAAAPKM
jgi:copper(I)-binding protein